MSPIDEAAAERHRLAEKLAYERGLEKGRVDSRLDQHEQRLNAINGSLAKVGTRLEALAYSMAKQEQAQDRRDAVSEALHDAVEEASKSQITTRTFLLGLAGFAVALSGVLTAVLS